ncbi:beta-class carbonic anhydrase [Shouchella clausii]|jgi:carbonic anhydrase|uniref:carbonic anhydrase n=1 Tax=Shouchella clausii TaxID=79880 RepID=A0A268RX30_SHOCL|nr:carbonic anhydrase [Shouchella clausii]PAD40750.1 carbonic anhydrase [Bacillus sp. 7520-S]SPT80631.1 carbonic anhydrase [Niallia circulans]AST96923.1 carbonic anhydrase [Shouchella clausii]MBU8597611.1 carbonic anhydrase [Shouchella clausii]MCM3547583.1 carbonic anhydrase [Shouchella clausii]
MSKLESILAFNEAFVANKEYERFKADKFPQKKIVILTCMDTRLVELLHNAMNLKNGDAKIIRNAGAVISHPFGSIMRSILVAIYELGAEEVFVIGHYGCGMTGLSANSVLQKAEERGIDMDEINALQYAGVDVNKFLTGFENVTESVNHSVDMVVNHPLLPKDVRVHGLVINPETGKLDLLQRDLQKGANAKEPQDA